MVHYRLAEGLLKTARERADDRGIALDVGEFPPLANADTGDTEDPERLAKLTAHAIARVGDRFGFVRKVSRHFEGTERRAGILSDITAALWVLYRRNPEAVEQIARQFRAELQARRAQVAARQAEKQQSTNGGVTQNAPV